jgi:hypothetical protein
VRQIARTGRVRRLRPFAAILAALALALVVTGCGGTISVGDVQEPHTYSAKDRDDFVASCARGGGDSQSCNCVFNHVSAQVPRDELLAVARRIDAGTMSLQEQAAFYAPFRRGCEPSTYTPAIRQNFMTGCTSNGGKRAYCGCLYDAIQANVPVARFLADDTAMSEGTMSQKQFERRYGQYMKPCV